MLARSIELAEETSGPVGPNEGVQVDRLIPVRADRLVEECRAAPNHVVQRNLPAPRGASVVRPESMRSGPARKLSQSADAPTGVQPPRAVRTARLGSWLLLFNHRETLPSRSGYAASGSHGGTGYTSNYASTRP